MVALFCGVVPVGHQIKKSSIPLATLYLLQKRRRVDYKKISTINSDNITLSSDRNS